MAIEVDAFHASWSYAGVYAGLPTPDETIASKRRYMERFWGPGRRVVVDPPAIVNKRVPKWCCMAWLVDTEAMRHAFVVWFSDEFPSHIHNEALARVEHLGGWMVCSDEFEW